MEVPFPHHFMRYLFFIFFIFLENERRDNILGNCVGVSVEISIVSKKALNTLLFFFFLFDYITSFEVGYLGLWFGKVMKFSDFYVKK